MKRVYKLFTAALLLAGTVVSCDLDSMSLTEKDTTNFPQTQEDADMALAAVYQNLNKVSANPQMSFFYTAMLASDECFGGGGPNDKQMQALDLMCNYQSNMTEQFWKDRYEGVNRANTLIEALEGIEMDESTKAQALGEAKFLRAFYYYELSSMYNRVPLVTAAVMPDDPTPPSAAAIWGQILQDLRDASATMPATRKTNGHVDKYTAEAMLGRAWLYYTGMYGNGEDLAALTSTTYSPLTSVELPDGTTLTKQDVIGYIDDCVNNSGYSLVPDFRNLWAYTNKFTVEDYDYTANQGLKWVEDDNAINPESMFAIKYNKQADWGTTIGYANNFALHFGVRGQTYADTFPFGQGWGAGPAAPNLVTDWQIADREGNDIRLHASVVHADELPNYVYGGGDGFVQETGYYQKKLLPISAKDEATEGGYMCCFENLMYGMDGWTQGSNNFQLNNIHDMIMIRFADVLLMQSELKEDVAGMNKVRARAGLEPLASYSLEALQNERRWELAFEGIRWNDIRRWHIAAAALEKQTNQVIYSYGEPDRNTAHNGGYAARYNATAGFQKIPENQISLSEGTLTQNEGWTGADSEYNGW